MQKLTYVLRHLRPAALHDHPLNEKLYGKLAVDTELASSIERNGVLEPIRATSTGLVISGHRRRLHAALCRPDDALDVLMINEELDKLETELLLIEGNRSREKSKEQRAREWKRLTEIEAELAKRRKAAAGGKGNNKNGPGENAGTIGEAKEKAAEAVGMSRHTAENAAAVVDAIDKAEEAGDTARAADLRKALNDGTVAKAHRKATGGDGQKRERGTEASEIVDGLNQKVPAHLRGVFQARADFDACASLVSQVKKRGRQLSETAAGNWLNANDLAIAADNLKNVLRFAEPYAVCPACSGNDSSCKTCKGTFFVTEAQYKRIPKREPGQEG